MSWTSSASQTGESNFHAAPLSKPPPRLSRAPAASGKARRQRRAAALHRRPFEAETWNSGANDPEANKLSPNARNADVANRRPSEPGRTAPASAAIHAKAASSRPRMVRRLPATRKRSPPVPDPLPHVPAHVV